MQQRDFLEGHQKVRGNVGKLPLHLRGRLLHRCFFTDREGDFENGFSRPSGLSLCPLVRLPHIDAKLRGGSCDLLVSIYPFGKDRRNRDQRGRRSRRRKGNGQEQERRNLVDNFRQRALYDLLTAGQTRVKIDGQSLSSRTHDLSSAAVDYRE